MAVAIPSLLQSVLFLSTFLPFFGCCQHTFPLYLLPGCPVLGQLPEHITHTHIHTHIHTYTHTAHTHTQTRTHTHTHTHTPDTFMYTLCNRATLYVRMYPWCVALSMLLLVIVPSPLNRLSAVLEPTPVLQNQKKSFKYYSDVNKSYTPNSLMI